MKDGRKPEYPEKTPDEELQKMPNTKAQKYNHYVVVDVVRWCCVSGRRLTCRHGPWSSVGTRCGNYATAAAISSRKSSISCAACSSSATSTVPPSTELFPLEVLVICNCLRERGGGDVSLDRERGWWCQSWQREGVVMSVLTERGGGDVGLDRERGWWCRSWQREGVVRHVWAAAEDGFAVLRKVCMCSTLSLNCCSMPSEPLLLWYSLCILWSVLQWPDLPLLRSASSLSTSQPLPACRLVTLCPPFVWQEEEQRSKCWRKEDVGCTAKFTW